MNFIENIQKKNQFPILFIGSGITQRYFRNSPTWLGLLQNLWETVETEQGFYDYSNQLRLQGINEFEISLRIADKLEQGTNELFSKGELLIDNLDSEKSYREKISPFKQMIANVFKELNPRDGVEAEIELFTKMLLKARFIITTNFDCFIEQCFHSRNTKIDVKVGNSGLFEKSNSYGELYKVHGTEKIANSVCITSEDYQNNESKLAIVNAKILSNLTDAPILFLGYSLTDENIKSLLKAYSENLPFNPDEAAARIGVVEWESGEERLIEIREYYHEIKMHYTRIKTDNYLEIYRQVSEIDQGILPSEIVKYEHAFRRIIEVKGPTKGLNTILADFEDISNLTDKQIEQKNIVVAFGDSKDFRKPIRNYVEYIRNYFSDEDVPLGMALGFLTSQHKVGTPIPFRKYQKMVDDLESIPKGLIHDTILLEERVSKYTKNDYIKGIKDNANIALSFMKKLATATTPKAIWGLQGINDSNKLKYIISKIDTFDLSDLELFVKDALMNTSDTTINNSDFRKIFMAYSLLADL